MEINDLSNKIDGLNSEFHKNLEGFIKFISGGLDMAKNLETELLSNMTKDEREQYKTFMRKYNSLMADGKTKEALKLKNKYLNE